MEKGVWAIIAIAGFVSFVGFMVLAFDIVITEIQIIGVTIIFVVISMTGVSYFFLRKYFENPSEDKTMKKAEDFAMKYVKDSYKEDLIPSGVGHRKVMGREKMIGFLLSRAPVGNRAGQPFAIVVRTEPRPFQIVYKNPTPGFEERSDVFANFAGRFEGMPAEGMMPEMEPWFWKYRRVGREPLVKQEFKTEKKEDEFFKEKKKE